MQKELPAGFRSDGSLVFWNAGKQYDTLTMSIEELIGYIDIFTRLELPDEKELRACVTELKSRIYHKRVREVK